MFVVKVVSYLPVDDILPHIVMEVRLLRLARGKPEDTKMRMQVMCGFP